MPDIATQIAGIDASKNHLDMAIHGHAKVTRVPNTVAGWKTLVPSRHDETSIVEYLRSPRPVYLARLDGELARAAA